MPSDHLLQFCNTLQTNTVVKNPSTQDTTRILEIYHVNVEVIDRLWGMTRERKDSLSLSFCIRHL